MNNVPPLRDGIPSTSWDNWFQQVFDALKGWNRSLTSAATFDFAAIPAQSQASTTVVLSGAQPGDTVQVMPSADVSGVIFTGAVVVANVVTIYAKNFSAGSVNPPSLNFRIIVLQA